MIRRRQRRVIDVESRMFVLVPLAEYRDLLKAKAQLNMADGSRQILFKATRSTVERDPEVMDFFMRKLGTEPVEKLVKESVRLFGKMRSPSKSAAYRFWAQLRRENTRSKGL